MPPDWLALYLEEDIGSGDITTDSVVPADALGRARVLVREACCVAGLSHVAEVFSRCGAAFTPHMKDGSWVEAGTMLGHVEGPARAILHGERVALNILGRMSGIATATRRAVELLAKDCSGAVVVATRKTTPGFRAFEKEAATLGGGYAHRQGLWDAAMIKDNHRAAAGSVAAAVRAVKAAHPGKELTAEVESLDDALAAAAAGTDWILIDNQTPDTGRTWAEAVWQQHPGVKVEASGGVTLDNLAAYGWADRISLGWLTHHAVSVDVSLEWQ